MGSADGVCGGGDQGQIDGLGEELQLEFDGGVGIIIAKLKSHRKFDRSTVLCDDRA